MGIFDMFKKKDKVENTGEIQLPAQVAPAEASPTQAETPVTEVAAPVGVAPQAVEENSVETNIELAPNPFMESIAPEVTTPTDFAPAPEIPNFDNIFNAQPTDLIETQPAPTNEGDVLAAVADTAAVIDTPQPIVEQQIALNVNPEEIFEGGSTKEDEITKIVSDNVIQPVENVEQAVQVENIISISEPNQVIEPTVAENITPVEEVVPVQEQVIEPTVIEPTVPENVTPVEEVVPVQEQVIEPTVIEPTVSENVTPVQEVAPVQEQVIEPTVAADDSINEITAGPLGAAAPGVNIIESVVPMDNQVDEENTSDSTPVEDIIPFAGEVSAEQVANEPTPVETPTEDTTIEDNANETSTEEVTEEITNIENETSVSETESVENVDDKTSLEDQNNEEISNAVQSEEMVPQGMEEVTSEDKEDKKEERQSKTKFCENCGTMITDDSSICPECGGPID